MRAFLFTAMVLYASFIQAFEPPRISIEEALGNGSLAFFARVVSLEEVQRNKFNTIAQLRAVVTKCLYGKDCVQSEIKIRYYSEIFDDAHYDVDFRVSRDYLFVFLTSQKMNETINFDSEMKNGVDHAFVFGSLPGETVLDQDMSHYVSVYWFHQNRTISRKTLLQEVEKRKVILGNLE